MAHIKIIPESEAQGELKGLYDRYKAPWGGVDSILKIHGLLPQTLKPHMDLYRTLVFGQGPLTRTQREMIAVVVSKTDECRYCVQHHGDSLFRLTKDKNFTNLVKTDFRAAELTEADQLMLTYAEELSAKPGAHHGKTVQKLKDAGFSDEGILHITLIIAYFNFVNRIANGLGVDLEGYWKEDGYSDPTLPMAHD